MSANTSPIFLLTPSVQWVSSGTAANTNMDGTGTVATVFTASGTNGSKIDEVIVEALGTNVATVLRLFINNGSSNGTAANNSLVWEQPIQANTVSQTGASIRASIPLNIALPAGYKLNCTIGTAVASGLQVTGRGGHF